MKLFVAGPVEMEADVLSLGADQPPYFRDEQFAEIVKEVSSATLRLANAPAGSKLALLTGFGTAAMEAAVINLFDRESRVLVIDGGTFGRRFVDLCVAYEIPHEVHRVAPGRALSIAALEAYRFDGVLMNAHETSTGQRNDVAAVGALCRRRSALLVCDAISSFLADPYDMTELGVNATVVSSNKGFAVAPGLAMVMLDPAALGRLKDPASLYLRLSSYFKNAERGQTPFTPAVNPVLQLQRRIEKIDAMGGADAVVSRVARIAHDFRGKARAAGFELFPETPSSFLSALPIEGRSSMAIYEALKQRYGFYVTPGAWGMQPDMIRVCHAGDLHEADNTALVEALVAVCASERPHDYA